MYGPPRALLPQTHTENLSTHHPPNDPALRWLAVEVGGKSYGRRGWVVMNGYMGPTSTGSPMGSKRGIGRRCPGPAPPAGTPGRYLPHTPLLRPAAAPTLCRTHTCAAHTHTLSACSTQ